MNNFLTYLTALLIQINLYGQNLIPNPSFENYINFDTKLLNEWHKVQKDDTPDYFNITELSNENMEYSANFVVKNGHAFVGFFCYRISASQQFKNVREFIEVELINPLEKEALFDFRISILLDNESNVAIKNLAVLLSDTPLKNCSSTKILLQKPQIVFDSTYLQNKTYWVDLKAIYKAKGGEKFIVLGNFSSDKKTDYIKLRRTTKRLNSSKWHLNKTELGAYYYIDNLSLTKRNSGYPLMKNNRDTIFSEELVFDIENIQVDSAITLQNIYFNFNESELLPQSFAMLNKLLNFMTYNPNVFIEIEGHTDNQGSYEYNMDLSKRRAYSVYNYLFINGINSNRISYQGYGYTIPIATNDNENGRKQNRRVMFKVVKK